MGTASNSLEQQVRDRIENMSYLPTTVAVAMKFMELGKDPEAEPDDYVKVIGSDGSLATKLLSLANSSWFGVRNKVTKPKVAVNLLGLGTVRTLALSYCLTGLHSELRLTAEESRGFWSAGLCKAVAAREFAALFDAKTAEEAFTAGLFQDFALPVMFACAREEVTALLEDRQMSNQTRMQKERALFCLDHAEIGRAIAQRLELPELFVDAVAFHHQHASLREFLGKPLLADAAYVASLFPHRLEVWNREDAQELRRFLAEREGAVDPGEFLSTVQEEFARLYAYFESGDKPELQLMELLETATREMADSTTRLVGTVQELLTQAASAGKEVHKLIREQDKLEQAATRDPLTKALNREGFTQQATETLTRAKRYGTSCAALYLDVDKFKQINDTLGHAAGDTTLQNVVAAIQSAIRSTDLLGRLGGDEFVVLLTDISRDSALQIAQRIISQVAASGVPGGQGNLSVSVGLLWMEHPGEVYGLENLLSAADKLMYEAKRGGGSRVQYANMAKTPVGAPA